MRPAVGAARRSWRATALRVVWWVRTCLGEPARVGTELALRASLVSRPASQIPVYFMNHRRADELWRMVAEALAMIKALDPRRFQRLRRDVPRILVLPGRRSFLSPATNSCFLHERLVRDGGNVSVASILVHEAVHARLRKMGLWYLPDLRVRMEELCVKEEIAFAKLLPDALCPKEGFLSYLEGRLRAYPPTVA